VLVRNCTALLGLRRRAGGGRRGSNGLCVAVIVVAAVVGADIPGESECRCGRAAGSRGTARSAGAWAIGGHRGRRSRVRAPRRGSINEGLILELANTVANNLAGGVGLRKLRRDGFSGGVCDGEAGGPGDVIGVRGGELVEVDLAIRLDSETGVRVGVGCGGIEGANSCEKVRVSKVYNSSFFGRQVTPSAYVPELSSIAREGKGRGGRWKMDEIY